MSDLSKLSIKPVIHYPRIAQVGRTYAMTIDLQPDENFEWSYEQEEYPIHCVVDSNCFQCKPVGLPVVVFHRFGGSYGSSKFLLTARSKSEVEVTITLINPWGITIRSIKITDIEINQTAFSEENVTTHGDLSAENSSILKPLNLSDSDVLRYKESIKERFGSISLDALDTTGVAYDNLRLRRLFVPQSVRLLVDFDSSQVAKARAEKQPTEAVDQVLGIDATRPQSHRTVILGDPGSGKSTILKAVLLCWAEKTIAEHDRGSIPFLIELRLYALDRAANRCNSFLEYLHQGNTYCRLNQLELDALLKEGRGVLLFDGVDEVFDLKLKEVVVEDIYRFSNSYPKVQIVVTSRWLGYKAQMLQNADFQHYMLQDLTERQIELFLVQWYHLTFSAEQQEEKERKQAQLQRAIKESKAISELAGNPLLLTMMAILNRNQELPRDRVRLYERASEVLLHQWDVERNLSQDSALRDWHIDVRDKQAMLRKVAHYMQANEDGLLENVISRRDLEQVLTDYLKTIEVDQAQSIARILVRQLRERNFILSYIGADNFSFVHRAFLEYFCASAFVYQFEKEKTLKLEELRVLYSEHFQDESWNEVLKLIAGMLGSRFIGDVISSLMNLSVNADFYKYEHPQENFTFIKSQGLNNLLLAADCLSEVRNRHDIADVDMQLLALIKREIKQDSTQAAFLDEAASDALVHAITSTWKENIEILSFLKKCVPQTVSYPDSFSHVPASAIKGVASYWRNDDTTFNWLKVQLLRKDEHTSSIRSAALSAIIAGWKSKSEALPLLKQVAEESTVSLSQQALKAVVSYWKNDEITLSWLQRLAEEESALFTDMDAVQIIADKWKDMPRVLEWLKQLAETKPFFLGKLGGPILVIADYWEDDPSTLPWLLNLVSQSELAHVRRDAITALAKYWKEHTTVIKVIREAAQNDLSESVRKIAVDILQSPTS
ncbi:MAG: NACHT domain-containing protein [Cyanobacteria bacterium P01_A01_bin.116]